ncbi:cytochrome P450 [Cerioporus squamosus]|nr:cytochrome P450 [Cerioporus squamosus]
MIIPQSVLLWQTALVLAAVYVVHKLVKSYRVRARSTPLAMPPRPSWLFGVSRLIINNPDASSMYEAAIARFYSVETWTYVQTKSWRVGIENLFGRWATVGGRGVPQELKANWDDRMASADSALTDVQSWMNKVSLDSIGIAGFSHDFGSLKGKHSAVAEVFDAMGRLKPSPITAIVMLFGIAFPFLWRLPTEVRKLERKLDRAIEEIAVPLLENTRKEMRGLGENGKEEKSIIGLLIKAEDVESSLQMSQDEIMAQMKVLILAGYETTSSTLPHCQFPSSDPTWEQLTNGAGLHYLDAVVHEILRIHAPVTTTTRVAAKDDIIPLSQPLRLPNGELTDHVAVFEGQEVTVPIGYVNTARSIWGEDAREFRPERWLMTERLPKKAQEVQGHRHLLTFIDGARMCLGRGFALAEFKVRCSYDVLVHQGPLLHHDGVGLHKGRLGQAVLGVLIKNYSFELPDGLETKIEYCCGVLPRPRVAGEKGACVPMRVRRVD